MSAAAMLEFLQGKQRRRPSVQDFDDILGIFLHEFDGDEDDADQAWFTDAHQEVLVKWTDRYSKFATEARADALSALPYKEFLQSDYWKDVRATVLKRDSDKCSICNHIGGIDVHHRTYANHGSEHLHLEDLVSLCHNCHQLFHHKLPKEPR